MRQGALSSEKCCPDFCSEYLCWLKTLLYFCFGAQQTPPPLEVPVNLIIREAEMEDQGLQWDEFEAATTFDDIHL